MVLASYASLSSGGGGLVSVNRSRRGKPLLNFGMFVIHSFFYVPSNCQVDNSSVTPSLAPYPKLKYHIYVFSHFI